MRWRRTCICETHEVKCVPESDVYLAPREKMERLVEAAKGVDQYDFEFGLQHNMVGGDELDAIAELGEALSALESDDG